jgi:hypothetical protein
VEGIERRSEERVDLVDEMIENILNDRAFKSVREISRYGN